MTTGLHIPHGLARTATLRTLGVDRAQLRHLVAKGELRQVCRGWWATTVADPDATRAVVLGGYLTCLSALGRHGLWIPENRDLHVRFPELQRSRRLSLPPGIKACSPRNHQLFAARAVDTPALALNAAFGCVSSEEFVAILDSAMHRHRLTPDDLVNLLRDASPRARRLVRLCDRAESGTESLVRLRLRARGIRVRPQRVIPGVGRVDMIVGNRLVIEVDSRAHHTGEDNYARDRSRDLELHDLKYLSVRLTYQQVMHKWPVTYSKLRSIFRRRDHLRRPLVEPLEDLGW